MTTISNKLEEGIDFLEDQIDDFFDKFFRTSHHLRISHEPLWRPSIEVFETDYKIYIIVELAGVEKSDINVVLDQGLLKIWGIRKTPKYPEKRRPRQMEIEYGRFERVLRIPDEIKEDKINVNYKNGLLTITLPKSVESRTIKIEVEEGK